MVAKLQEEASALNEPRSRLTCQVPKQKQVSHKPKTQPRGCEADGRVSNSNRWNDWQREHKGLGLSPSEYSAMYRQARVKVVQRKDVLNAWNLWKRAHKGQGLSALERSACYKRENLSLCESEIPQELANAGAGRTSAATPVGGGIAQSVIPRSLSGDPLGLRIPPPARPKDIYCFCHHRLLIHRKFCPYTQMLDVAVNGLLLKLPKWHLRSTGELPIWNSSRLVHATDKVIYVISNETAAELWMQFQQ